MDYYQKYLKYKNKYNQLLQQYGGYDINLNNNTYYTNDYNNIENVSTFPLGHHVFSEGGVDERGIIKESDHRQIQTYPDFDHLIKPKTIYNSYTKFPNYETKGSYLNQYKDIKDKQCAERCTNNRNCNSFNYIKNKKKNENLCHHSVNNTQFLPDVITNNDESDFYQKDVRIL